MTNPRKQEKFDRAKGKDVVTYLYDIAFVPYCMDVKTLKANLQYTKKLTENDKKRLAALAETEFGETVEFMLENNCKLEQEAMDLMEIGI